MPDPVVSPSSSAPAPPPAPAPPAPVSSAPTLPSPATTPPSPAPTPAPAPAVPPASARPSYVPESFWDATAGKVKDAEFAAHYNEIATRIAAEDSRKLTLPASPDAYKVELPKDFTPPQGVEFKFNETDPLLAQARTVAHELGIPQEGFSRLLGLYAGAQVSSQTQIEAARQAEVAKLGTTGPARVDAVTRWAKATLGDAEGAQFASRMFTASDVMNAEKLIAKMTGGGNFRKGGSEPPEPAGKLSADVVSKMSLQEQLAYARQFPQPKSHDGRAA